MDPISIIESKRDGRALKGEEIDFMVQGYTRGEVPDHQMAALLMAVYLRGMEPEETLALTRSMLGSGKRVEFRGLGARPVDKHSTGGVGDKITLTLVPLAAACGVPVPMLSGRSLRHSGGTLDKLESIPGFRTELTLDEYRRGVERVGAVIMGQTGELAPADRKLYALRDFTATVPSLALITGSILSKKAAGGAEALVLDVKCGAGAFMRQLEEARALGELLRRVGGELGLQVAGFITRMDEPIGRCVGNALEVRESLEVLRGEGPEDTTELTVALGAEMLLLGGATATREEGEGRIRGAIASGAGAEKFREIIGNQGGDGRIVDEPERLPKAEGVEEVAARESGRIGGWDARLVGLASMDLGAGRSRAEEVPDPAVGIEILKKRGERVLKGEPVARLHWRDAGRLEAAKERLAGAVEMGGGASGEAGLIMERI